MGMFTDKIAIVTGGASGIGRAVSEEMARRGANLILADLDSGLLEETAGSIDRSGGKAKSATIDVTDFDAVKSLVDETFAEQGRIDYMFNNAGVAVIGLAHDQPYDDWRWVIDVDLYGVVNGVVAAYPLMVKQGFGHIVNTASLAGLIPTVGEISYCAAKYGVVGLSNTLRIEGRKYGVKVSVVCPGFIRTPIYDSCKMARLDREKALEAAPKGIDVNKGAQVILRGVERNKAIIPVTPLAHIMWALQRISPGLTRVLVGLLMREYEKARIE